MFVGHSEVKLFACHSVDLEVLNLYLLAQIRVVPCEALRPEVPPANGPVVGAVSRADQRLHHRVVRGVVEERRAVAHEAAIAGLHPVLGGLVQVIAPNLITCINNIILIIHIEMSDFSK